MSTYANSRLDKWSSLKDTLCVGRRRCQHDRVTRSTFEAGFVQLVEANHPARPDNLEAQVHSGVGSMIEAAVRSVGDGGLRPEVVYAIRASKLAARLLPPDVYRDPERRAQIKTEIRSLVKDHLTPASAADATTP